MKRTLCWLLLCGVSPLIWPGVSSAAGHRPATAEAAVPGPPNIVLIISDDQAWTDFGFMGHEHIQTPHIDRLAAQSLVFTRGYVCDSLCRPSLATIVTGLYPHQHGIVGNDPPPPGDLKNKSKAEQRRDPRYLQRRIDYIKHIDGCPKLAEILDRRLGYLSHQSGKWWEGSFRRGGFTHGMTHGDRRRGGRHGDDGLVIGRKGLEPIVSFIDEATKQNKPFFVYYAPFMPHTPHTPPARLLNKYRDKTPHLPIAKYWAMCEWFDETVGQLMGQLDEKGLAENTLVLFVVDNGWINQTTRSAYAPRSKRSQYEGGVRTPIMVRWPGKVKPKMDRTHAVSSIDLVPTALAAVGIEPDSLEPDSASPARTPDSQSPALIPDSQSPALIPDSQSPARTPDSQSPAPTAELPGINLLDAEAVANRKAIFGEIFEHDIQHMTDPVASLRFRWVIAGEWKLILPHAAREPNAAAELFHVTADPHERKNLATERPDLVARLTERLDEWWSVQR